MSIENFRDRYNFPDLKDQILKDKERFPQMSSVAVLAMKFADFGGEELKSEEAKIRTKGSLFAERYKQPYRASSLEMKQVAINYSAIIFGLSIKFTESALFEEVFDKPGFVREHNDRINGSVIYDPLHSQPWDVHLMLGDQLRQLRELAQNDKTLSVFFEEGYSFMPYFIQQYVGHEENLTQIRRSIIPIYKPLAEKLVDE